MNTSQNLVEKFNKSGPRYTSYPPVPFWSNNLTESEWINHLARYYDPSLGVDLYVHIPFCESLCYYCGCNRTITKNHEVEKDYLSLLLREWRLYIQKLGLRSKINSLHLGGGTPTFLSPEHLNQLLQELTNTKTESFIGSIEIDPRTCHSEHLNVLRKTTSLEFRLGFKTLI